MELVGRGIDRKAVIELDGYAAALDRVKALLSALQSWNGEIPPDTYTLFCISSLIESLLPSEDDCNLLDRYHRQRQQQEEQENEE